MGKPQQAQVEFSKDASVFLAELAFVLLKNEVFSFIENAENYVDFISDEITENIHLKKHHLTNLELKKFGKYYAIISANKRTAWHVFFDKKDNRYFINKITNNHLPTAKTLNSI